MPTAQLVKWGNSLAVRIPKPVAKEARMKKGDSIEVEVIDGHIELRRSQRTPRLKDLVTGITPENRYHETDWGSDQGKELVEW
jgi:antitoxin MazE